MQGADCGVSVFVLKCRSECPGGESQPFGERTTLSVGKAALCTRPWTKKNDVRNGMTRAAVEAKMNCRNATARNTLSLDPVA